MGAPVAGSIALMSCAPIEDLCRRLDRIVEALNDPWGGFAGVLLATLLGAVIGAGAAFLFSLILRAQQRKDAAEDFARNQASKKALDEARAVRDVQLEHDRVAFAQDIEASRRLWETQRDERHRDEMREALFVASLVPIAQSLHDFATHLQSNHAQAERDRRDVMGLIRLARIHSTPDQREVLKAAFVYVNDETRVPKGPEGTKNAERIADLIVAWREGSLTDGQTIHELGIDYRDSLRRGSVAAPPASPPRP